MSIRVVLVEPTHPGNVGAAARAMKTMGLSDLHLVNPKRYPSAEATARAAGADDLLYRAVLHESLGSAVADCSYIVGTSARLRRIGWPELDPTACAERCVDEVARGGRVAIVFGRENSGLTNEELDQCHVLSCIPTNPQFSSLNIASAVQVFAYECLRAATLRGDASAESTDLVSGEELERFYDHLTETLTEIGYFDPQKPKLLLRRLRRMFNRMNMDQSELKILRGVLSAVQRLSRRSRT